MSISAHVHHPDAARNRAEHPVWSPLILFLNIHNLVFTLNLERLILPKTVPLLYHVDPPVGLRQPLGNRTLWSLQSPVQSGPVVFHIPPPAVNFSLPFCFTHTALVLDILLRCFQHALPAPQPSSSTRDILPLVSPKPWPAPSLRSAQKMSSPRHSNSINNSLLSLLYFTL